MVNLHRRRVVNLVGVSSHEGLDEQLYVTDVVFLPKIIDTIKQAIMNFGALYTTMYWQAASYNNSNYTYYLSGSMETNHAIMLVGWDDAKVTAGGIGAWICQNSWGTSWGQSGFFYVSFNDANVNSSVGYFKKKKNIVSDLFMLYQVDTLGSNYGYGYGDSICYGLIKYTSNNNFDIRSVSTYAKSSKTKIEISVFDEFVNGSLSGLLAAIPVQTCTHPGYYTFEFPASFVVPQGDDFYIRVKYTTPGTIYPAAAEAYVSGYAYPHISGNCWISHNGNNNTWYHLNDIDLAIKVYAQARVSAEATTLVHPSCYGTEDGSISLQTWGGQAPYSYSWNTTPVQTTSNISGLAAGLYHCTITDAINNANVYDFNLIQPDSIPVNLLNLVNNDCWGQAQGQIGLSSVNTTFAEQFASAVINVSSNDNITPSTNLTGTANNASWSPASTSDGEYCSVAFSTPAKINKIKIYEQDACGAFDSVWVRNATTSTWHAVWTGSPFFIQHDSIRELTFPLTSFNVDAVKVSLNAVGFLFYPQIDAISICIPNECTYLWSTGQNTPNIQNLAAGNYSVTVTNAENCQKNMAFVITQPDSLMVSAMNDTTICRGSSVQLTAHASGQLSWYLEGNTTPLSNTSVAPVAETSYVAKATTSCGVVFDTVTIKVDEPPTVHLINDTILCGGASMTLPSAGTGLIHWYVQGDSQPMDSLFITPGSTQYYVVIAQNGICPDFTDTVQVQVMFVPEGAGSVLGASTVCQGDVETYTVPDVAHATQYLWTLPAGASGSSTVNAITVSYGLTALSGNITVQGSNYCGQGGVFAFPVQVKAKPATPVITLNGTMFHSSAPYGNQWYIQGMSIIGGNTQDYDAVTPGDYHVVVTLNGCASEPSNIIHFDYSGFTEGKSDQRLRVMPNPVNDELYICCGKDLVDAEFDIFDAMGNQVVHGCLKEQIGLDVKNLASGVYILKTSTGNAVQFMKE